MLLSPLSPPARFLVCFGLTAPCLLITLLCVLTAKDQHRIEDAFDEVRHTLQRENRIHELVLAVHQVDSWQRAYLYTGRNAYLESYLAAEPDVALHLRALSRSIVEGLDQQRRLTEIGVLVSNRLEISRQIVELKKSGRQEQAVKLARTDTGKTALQSIDELARDMRGYEDIQLAKIDANLMARRRGHSRWLYALLALNISSLGCILLLLRRLGNTQSLARICAWSNRIEHEGQWLSFEDYLNRRFRIASTHTISPSALDRYLTEHFPKDREQDLSHASGSLRQEQGAVEELPSAEPIGKDDRPDYRNVGADRQPLPQIR